MKKKEILIAGLAMAIGWGIRGNFGHQYDAAFAGLILWVLLSVMTCTSLARTTVLLEDQRSPLPGSPFIK